MNPRQGLLELYATGLAAVNGTSVVYRALLARAERNPCHVVAIGKAADAMLEGARRYLHHALRSALLITKHGHVAAHTATLDNVQICEAAHPVPDESSLAAGQALLDYLQALPVDEPVLFLISGGTSSLVEVLADGWVLEGLQALTNELLANGADIHEINAMRRSVSRIKGGQLWDYLGERAVTCLLMSDVPNDDPEVIGSGLLFPAPSARDFDWQMVANNAAMLEAMAASELFAPTTIMPEFLVGDVLTAASTCVQHLLDSEPGIYLWGAETTVQLPEQPGRGGRNQHFALAAALQLQDADDCLLLVAGTDGTDGMTADAGALVDSGTCLRGNAENLDPVACLHAADAGTFLEASGDLIHVGVTGTNVMDVVIGLKL